jgi:hypothetical protein
MARSAPSARPATGEVHPPVGLAIARALRAYPHPDQLLRRPGVELQSLHPNHVWQIDASLCVLYYLNVKTEKEAGLQVMEAKKFYKNKPANLKRIENDRVWSYEVTDHNSAASSNYVLGAESAANLAESFILATEHLEDDRGCTACHDSDDGHGLGQHLGASRTCARLQVEPMPTPENARATGQVENARNIIERSFEITCAFSRSAAWKSSTPRLGVGTLVQRHQGAQPPRHDRLQQWMTITQDQLRLVDADLARKLLTSEPERRKVSDTLTVQFSGQEFDVRAFRA